MEIGRKMILDLIEQSVAAYELREELCVKLQSLEGKSSNEQNIHLQVIFFCRYSIDKTNLLIPQLLGNA